jgi:hypothetical protein
MALGTVPKLGVEAGCSSSQGKEAGWGHRDIPRPVGAAVDRSVPPQSP